MLQKILRSVKIILIGLFGILGLVIVGETLIENGFLAILEDYYIWFPCMMLILSFPTILFILKASKGKPITPQTLHNSLDNQLLNHSNSSPNRTNISVFLEVCNFILGLVFIVWSIFLAFDAEFDFQEDITYALLEFSLLFLLFALGASLIYSNIKYKLMRKTI